MPKRNLAFVALAVWMLVLIGATSAHAQPLSQTVTLDGYTFSIPADWAAQVIPNSGVGIVSNPALLAQIEDSDANFAPGDLAIVISNLDELGPIVEEGGTARDLMDTFIGFLSPGAEVVEVEGLPFEAYRVEVETEEFPSGRALLYTLDLNGFLVFVAVVSGGPLNEVSGLAEDILATLSYEVPPRPEPVGALVYGDEVTGEIGGESETQVWTFEGQAGDRVTITMIADEESSLDTTLTLYTLPEYEIDGAPIAFNDDAMSEDVIGFNSQIAAFELFEDATYAIEASSFGSSGGAYTLSLVLADEDAATPVPEATTEAVGTGGGEIAYGDTVTGAVNDEGTNSEYWTFSGQAGDVVTITMIADDTNEVDPRLYLYAEGEVSAFDILAENDDAEDSSIGRLNSQIFEFELPVDGEYVIEATQFGFGAGTYSLTLESGAAGSAGEGKPTAAQSGDELRQWASDATGSSQYGTDSWSFLQATGEPNTDECGDITTAWASATSSGKDDLSLTYEVPVIPSQISIYQTYNPGSIIRVEVSNSGTEETAELPNSADDSGNTVCPGVFVLEVEDIGFAIDTVTIYLDQTIGGSWNEIDAVELVGVVP